MTDRDSFIKSYEQDRDRAGEAIEILKASPGLKKILTKEQMNSLFLWTDKLLIFSAQDIENASIFRELDAMAAEIIDQRKEDLK